MEEMVQYEGRQVPKKHFRVVVYKPGYQMLVNSYEEYTEALRQGWHITKELAELTPPVARRGRKRNDGNGT